ncbi:hypothetical protein [Sphingomonas sp.]|uniref:hypothetical protein n=1 Tax=Sphingomonas sp. TaxID=28214 RepID=UPI003B3A0149
MQIALPAQAAAPAQNAQAARFHSFFTTFRAAVLKGDRNAVANMVSFPFKDFRSGNYCEPGDTQCKLSPTSAASRDRAEFLKKYDRIFTPAVIAAIRAGRVHGFRRGQDDGEVAGPIVAGEYLLDAEDVGDQRVFVPVGNSWKLARIPFYS